MDMDEVGVEEGWWEEAADCCHWTTAASREGNRKP
jgi:hypothetical protein